MMRMAHAIHATVRVNTPRCILRFAPPQRTNNGINQKTTISSKEDKVFYWSYCIVGSGSSVLSVDE
jgi:hypothetical protein